MPVSTASGPVGVIVDDGDPTIQYAGSWTVNASDSLGPDGQTPMYNSLHKTQSNAIFSFFFNGTSVSVMGATLSSSRPKWNCYIDGIQLLTLPFTDGLENLPLCSQTLKDGPHKLLLVANATQDSPFWFDYIKYRPSPTDVLDGLNVVLDPNKTPTLEGNWAPLSPSGFVTRGGSSKASLQFNGVSITWIGVYNNSSPGASTTATYAVDGETPKSFTLNNYATNTTPVIFDQVIFQTSTYPLGQHSLEVTYDGDTQTAPLSLTSLVVQSHLLPQLPSNTSSTSSDPSASPPNMERVHKSKLKVSGPIAGGVLGGFVVIAVFSYSVYRKRRKTKRSRDLFISSSSVQPFNDSPHYTTPRNPSSSWSSSGKLQMSTPFTVRPPSKARPEPGRRESPPPSSIPGARSSGPIVHIRPSPELRVHEDSGLRLTQSETENANVINIPPIYSPV